MDSYVAPHVGAWIETGDLIFNIVEAQSHPMWVRGLKLLQHLARDKFRTSHPMWVRGLKLKVKKVLDEVDKSHPMWVRGLKQGSK